jgi:peptide alpha-N-acetyltransferase
MISNIILSPGRLYLLSNQNVEAQEVYEKLIESNPDNSAYYYALEKAMGIENSPEKKMELYRHFEKKFPRAILPRRLPLDCAPGEVFLSLLRPYMESTFVKGVPPLFTDLRTLYKDQNKAKQIENLVENMVAQLEKHSKFSPGNNLTQCIGRYMHRYR